MAKIPSSNPRQTNRSVSPQFPYLLLSSPPAPLGRRIAAQLRRRNLPCSAATSAVPAHPATVATRQQQTVLKRTASTTEAMTLPHPSGDANYSSAGQRMRTTAMRRWWMRRDGSDDADDVVPMDTQEQEELVGSLEQKQAHHSRRWRRVFAGFLLGYAAFLVYASFRHAWSPWELRHHSYFMEDLPSPMVIFADWIAALGCLFAVKGLLQASNSSKKWMWYSLYVGIAVSIFWTYYLLKLPRIRWDVVWLPLGPLFASALSLYVDHTLMKSMQDISTLRSYMYNFKSL